MSLKFLCEISKSLFFFCTQGCQSIEIRPFVCFWDFWDVMPVNELSSSQLWDLKYAFGKLASQYHILQFLGSPWKSWLSQKVVYGIPVFFLHFNKPNIRARSSDLHFNINFKKMMKNPAPWDFKKKFKWHLNGHYLVLVWFSSLLPNCSKRNNPHCWEGLSKALWCQCWCLHYDHHTPIAQKGRWSSWLPQACLLCWRSWHCRSLKIHLWSP